MAKQELARLSVDDGRSSVNGREAHPIPLRFEDAGGNLSYGLAGALATGNTGHRPQQEGWGMLYARFKYKIYLWSPPRLTPEEEVSIGRDIALMGYDHFKRRAPYLGQAERDFIESARHFTINDWIQGGVVFIILLTPLIVFPLLLVPILVIGAFILVVSGGSLLYARAIYHKWLRDMLAKYAVNIAINESDSIGNLRKAQLAAKKSR